MTNELFLKDAYLKEFAAKVVRHAGREMILDGTAFYPAAEVSPRTGALLGSVQSGLPW